jgi:uncharacterized protein YegL
MTNPNLAYIQLIIDRSGSMQSLRPTVVSGVNDFLAGQRKQPGVCHAGLTWFGGIVDMVYDNKPLSDVKDLILADYKPDGGTPMNEAICRSIDALGERLAKLPEADRPALVTVLIVTDGQENASAPEFTNAEVKRRVEEQTKRYNWNFQYLCANQDVVTSAATYGFSMSNAANFSASVGNTKALFAAASAATSRGRGAVLRGASVGEAVCSMAYTTSEVQSLVDPAADPLAGTAPAVDATTP